MSLRTLFPNLLRAHPTPSALPKSTILRTPKRAFHDARSVPGSTPSSAASRFKLSTPPPRAIAIARPVPQARSRAATSGLYTTIGLGLTFLSLSSLRKPTQCESAYAPNSPYLSSADRSAAFPGDAPPESLLNLKELGFGTVAGICAGVFLKKGLKAIAFALGGMFVLLQVGRSTHADSSVGRQPITSRYCGFASRRGANIIMTGLSS